MKEMSQGALGIEGWSSENVLICITVDRQLVASPGPEQMHTSVLEQTRVSEWSFGSEVWIGGVDWTFGFCSKEQGRQ